MPITSRQFADYMASRGKGGGAQAAALLRSDTDTMASEYGEALIKEVRRIASELERRANRMKGKP